MTATLDDDVVVRALEPFGSLPRWLAAAMLPDVLEAALRRHVPELVDGRQRLLWCTPERLRAKSDQWVARYRLEVALNGGPPVTKVLVGRLWPPCGARPDPAAQVEVSDGVPFGEPGWRGWLPDLRLELEVEEADGALPALPSLVDPETSRELVQSVLRGAGRPEVTVASCRPEVVRYKPGSRCTVVCHLTYPDTAAGPGQPELVVLKTHQGDKGRVAWDAMRALWDTPLARGDVVTLAEPLGYLPDDRVLVQGPVPEEQTLKELARHAISTGTRTDLAQLRTELAKTGRALAALHACGARHERTATLELELDEVQEVVDRLTLSVPTLVAAADPLVARLRRLALERPADPLVPAHHDFRPAQVLLHEGRVGFIDFDGSAMAEPALDVGRFRAKLRDIGISALAASGESLSGAPLAANVALLDELCDHFLAGYQQHGTVNPDRVVLWETCDLLTAMLHAWTKVRLARIEPRLQVLLHQLRSPALG